MEEDDFPNSDEDLDWYEEDFGDTSESVIKNKVKTPKTIQR